MLGTIMDHMGDSDNDAWNIQAIAAQDTKPNQSRVPGVFLWINQFTIINTAHTQVVNAKICNSSFGSPMN
ncbi:hypothetical protein J8M21_25000 [Pseudoalteromonas luteoviolacea]|uniref:hypothetical protein n=1 Tax=Pseudoalteromonas luteoviolacea TaxID=43657 RepID=UPI001B3A323C|nr:hypothetical protein [Pseudoalteromonas luteoviolacea]MBQ4880462.1 hypothetical protein [Pseudoalteromonas luteoviolacea]MBQ4909523.1 hypothetical protein [Pseudoalteromonas luteoviolacea]